ncbi:GNAT family N-acetyltransferase [Massilia sp. 2TAF26]|uniref:GNAT family N-acetyltransferase n=1 Tax=Massilia sp. 2TAF26 TaxID=3233012 RepID=UPI003F993D09
MNQLHTGHFLLRPFAAADASSFAEAVRESMASVGQWMSWAHAGYTKDEALSWFDFCDGSRAAGSAHEFGIFLEDDRTLVGGAGLNQFNTVNGFCNLGYWVRASQQRRGAALAAVHLLARHAFDALKLSRVEIVIADGNLPSLAVARKAGAVHECLARNRLQLHGGPVAAHVLSLVPEQD